MLATDSASKASCMQRQYTICRPSRWWSNAAERAIKTGDSSLHPGEVPHMVSGPRSSSFTGRRVLEEQDARGEERGVRRGGGGQRLSRR